MAQAGFEHPECFWRRGPIAILGGTTLTATYHLIAPNSRVLVIRSQPGLVSRLYEDGDKHSTWFP